MSTFNKYRLKGAFHYDWYKTEDWYKYLVDRCVEFCKPDGSIRHTVVDVGCGDGLLANMVASKYRTFTYGIDPDANGIALAKAHMDSPVEFRQQGIEDFKEHVDYLTCLNVVEHLDRPEILRDYIRDCVKKGAIITTIDYQGGSLGEDHRFEWTLDEMVEFFKEFNPKPFRYKDTEWIGVEINK